MRVEEKKVIVNVLEKLDFVRWDRYVEFEGIISFFGWIDREDNYKDFVLVDFVEGVAGYMTSSKEYSEKIGQILNCPHTDCKRVEHFCDLDNVVKLKEKENGEA